MFGAAITTAGIVAVLCVFTFGLHPSRIMLEIMDEMNARREERDEELNHRIQESSEQEVAAFVKALTKSCLKIPSNILVLFNFEAQR